MKPSNFTVPRTKFEDMQAFVEDRINGGLVTTLDKTDIKNNQFETILNAHVRYDKTSRRGGLTPFSIAIADANAVLALVPYVSFTGSVSILRFTKSSVHVGSSSSWTLCTTGAALTGTTSDRIRATTINNRVFFTNNGKDVVQELDVAAFTYAAAGNAEKYRYSCGFFNRLVVANLAGASPNPIKIAWSGDNNFDEFDPSADLSAGFEFLIESPSDFSDFITGLFGFANAMIVLRQRSLWLATKQPIATAPFYFYTAVPNIGCDCPNSAVQIPGGICWVDKRTACVYTYTLGAEQPVPIGRAIDKDLVAQIENVDQVFATYDTANSEYSIAIPSTVSSTVRTWTYNFLTQAWTQHEYDGISSIANLDYSAASLAINELPGTINQLQGVINDLGVDISTATQFFGKTDGEILYADPTALSDDGGFFLTSLVSKTYKMTSSDMYVAQLRIEYEVQAAGFFDVKFSKDAGQTFTALKSVSFGADDIGKRKIIYCNKHIKARNFTWKIDSLLGVFDLLSYEIHVYPGAKSKDD